MRILLVSTLAAFAVTLATAAPSINGKWQIHTSIAGNESDQVCTFTQKEDAIAGSCVSDRGTVEIRGNIKGNKVTWSYKSEYNGTPLTVMYEGALDAETKFGGSVNVPEFGAAGDFTATQSK